MLAGRGFATAATLVLIALTCIAFAKRLERERRLLRRLREADGVLTLESLNEDERETAETLRKAGVLRVEHGRGYVRPEGLRVFRGKRVRVAVSGAAIALVLAVVVAFVLLR